MHKLEDHKPQKGIAGFLNTLVRRQPVEKSLDPVRGTFDETKSQFMEQQNDFRTVVEETLSRLDRARRD